MRASIAAVFLGGFGLLQTAMAQEAAPGIWSLPATFSRPLRLPGTPLPRPDPRRETHPAPEAPPADVASDMPPEPSACFVALSGNLADVQALPAIAGENGCEAPDVVQLDAIFLPDRRRIDVSPPAVLRCTMATAVANWVREDLLAAIAGEAPRSLDNFDSFECRGMNRVNGAKISEHGRANALDIRAVLLSSGKRLALTDPGVARDLRESLRRSACARFTTVLGPGSDGYHEDHVHIDLAQRQGGYRICQWDVRDPAPPLPRSRPPEAPAVIPATPEEYGRNEKGGVTGAASSRPR